MAFVVTEVGEGYEAICSSPHGLEWQSERTLTLQELISAANDLGIHVQDFWDAVIEADPSAVNT